MERDGKEVTPLERAFDEWLIKQGGVNGSVNVKDAFEAGAKYMENQRDFVVAYLNPRDTSFRNMIDSFNELGFEQQIALMDLCHAFGNLKNK